MSEGDRRGAPGWRRARRVAVAVAVLVVGYVATLVAPGLFFAHTGAGAFIVLHSDAPLPPEAARVIREARVERSPIFDRARAHHVYVCTSGWRWSYFSFFDDRSRAFATPLGRAVYTRAPRWGRESRLLGPRGDASARTLDAYVAHEVTHTLTTDHLGVVAAARLPVWVREATRSSSRGERRSTTRTRCVDSRRGDAALESRRRDPYLVYLLLVTHLIERERWSVERLLRAPPERAHVERAIRGSRPT